MKQSGFKVGTVLIGLVFFLAFLGSSRGALAQGNDHADSQESHENVAEGWKKDFSDFNKKMSEQLSDAGKNIKSLGRKIGTDTNQSKSEAVKQLEDTRENLNTRLNAMASDLKKRGQKNWGQAKRDFADSVDKLNQKIQKMSHD